jgi:hypothetical protein
MTLKEQYENQVREYKRHAEVLLGVTDFRNYTLMMGSGCDQSDFRKEYWLKARDQFVHEHMKEINQLARDMVMNEIGE